MQDFTLHVHYTYTSLYKVIFPLLESCEKNQNKRVNGLLTFSEYKNIFKKILNFNNLNAFITIENTNIVRKEGELIFVGVSF